MISYTAFDKGAGFGGPSVERNWKKPGLALACAATALVPVLRSTALVAGRLCCWRRR